MFGIICCAHGILNLLPYLFIVFVVHFHLAMTNYVVTPDYLVFWMRDLEIVFNLDHMAE